MLFEPSFQNDQASASNKNKGKVRVEYAAGFRQLQTSHLRRQKSDEQNSEIAQKSGNHILHYIEAIGVENLPMLYLQSLPDNSKLLLQKQRQHQEQSVVRLYKNIYPSRKSQTEDEDEEQAESKRDKYAQQIWTVDKKFEEKPKQFIAWREIENMDRKIKMELQGVIKRKKLEDIQLQLVFAAFLLSQTEQITKMLSNKKSNAELDLLYAWKGFINTVNLQALATKLSNHTIGYRKLEQLRKICKYLFYFIQLPHLEEKQANAKIYNIKQVSELICYNLKPQSHPVTALFEAQRSYTCPLNITDQAKSKAKSKRQELTQRIQVEVSPFKANPIPKSTYQEPKPKDKKEHQPIVPKPFNLKEKEDKMTPEQYYQFQKQRNFKAQEVPQTIYKPFQPKLLSEEQKKARAVMSLQKSKYPKTMQNLDQYKEELNKKSEQLAHKYEKSTPKIQIHPIPDFNRLHAEQLVKLDTIKEKNNKSIKVQEFHLSTGRGKPIILDQHRHNSPTINPYSPPGEVKQVKSTKKFDTYVKFRTQYEKQKKQKKEAQETKKEVEQKKKQPYHDIIKERMADEFRKQPQRRDCYDDSMPKRIKVDRIKIYREKPLLMGSWESGQIQDDHQDYDLGWEPIF